MRSSTGHGVTLDPAASSHYLNLIKEEFIPDTIVSDDSTLDLSLLALCCKLQEPAL